MKCHREDLRVEGLRLHRYVFTPGDGEQVRASAFLFHGQGDYSERYQEVMEVFTRAGVACVLTDLPGHGRSSGRRGHIPGFGIVDAVAESNHERCRELCPPERGPLGLLGHSAGGLMALRELLRHPSRYGFSWISSPLVVPEANQSPLMVALARLASGVLPRLTVSTGVTPGQCFHEEEGLERTLHDVDPLFHSRVSLGWGHAMVEAARETRSRFVTHPPAMPLLLTQGSDDPVCPPRLIRDLLDRTTVPHLEFREFEGALHEPFSDSGKERVFTALEEWLAATLGAPDQTSPSG